MSEQKSKPKIKRKSTAKPKPISAMSFSVWNVNGGPLSDDAVVHIEEAMERAVLELFNQGERLLTSTAKG